MSHPRDLGRNEPPELRDPSELQPPSPTTEATIPRTRQRPAAAPVDTTATLGRS